MSWLKKIKEWLEIEEVKPTEGKPPAKTTEKPVHTEAESVQPPEKSAIEVKEPEPVEPAKIGEEGRRRRIKR